MKSPTERNEGRGPATRPATGRRPPLVSEQLSVGVVSSLLLALGEGLRVAVSAPHASGGDLTLATFHTIAFYLPAGALFGLLMALLIAVVRSTPSLAPLLGRLSTPHLWLAPAPQLSGTMLGWAAATGLVTLGSRVAYEYLATVAHRIDLAAWTMAGYVLLLLVAAFLLASLVRVAVVKVARRLGRAASPGALVVLGLGMAAAGTARWLVRHPAVVEVYGEALILIPLAMATYLICAVIGRALLRRSRRGARIVGGVLIGVALAAWLISARTYGARNAVRTLVEEDTIAGRWLLHRYTRATDLDGDRYAWGFGGRDCNDFDARIHPGTLDQPGDGVDLDCFGGDGSPVVRMDGDGAYGARPARMPSRPNFVIVTIDALRPDHLGIEGYRRDTSPNIDAFGRTAVRFREAAAPSSRSIRSIPAMFTGLYPSRDRLRRRVPLPSAPAGERHPRRDHARARLADGGDDGHRVLPPLARLLPGVRGDRRGAGVQAAEHRGGGPRAPAARRARRVRPALPPVDPPLPRPQALSAAGRSVPLRHDAVGPIRLGESAWRTSSSSGSSMRWRRTDCSERTVVILASDHGEAFGEHGQSGHASTLYQEEIDATLMIHAPGIAPRRVDGTVSLMDLTPTVLNMAGIEVPHPMPAESMLPLMTGQRQPDPNRWLFGELLPDGLFPFDIKSIRHGDAKLHWWLREGTVQLFDLAADPGEHHDLSDARPEEAEELLGTLQAWVARSSREQHRNTTFIHEHLMDAPPAHMTHPLGLRFPGLFTLLGCDIPQTEVSPGGTLDVTCYYRVEGETDRDLFFRLMIEAPRGYALPRDMHALHYPLHGRYHTDQWREGGDHPRPDADSHPADGARARRSLADLLRAGPAGRRQPALLRAARPLRDRRPHHQHPPALGRATGRRHDTRRRYDTRRRRSTGHPCGGGHRRRARHRRRPSHRRGTGRRRAARVGFRPPCSPFVHAGASPLGSTVR